MEPAPSSRIGLGISSGQRSRFSALSTEKHGTVEQRKLRNYRIFIGVSGTTALAFLLTLSTFVIRDYGALSRRIPAVQATTCAAAILDPVGLVAILVLIFFNIASAGHGWLKRVVLPLTGALIAVLGACMSLSAILVKRSEARQSTTDEINSFSVEAVIWSWSLVTQLLFYTVVILGRQPPETKAQKKPPRTPPKRPRTPPTPLRIVAPPFALPQASTPYTEAKPESKRTSWRESLYQVVKPVNPRALILSQRATICRDSSTSVLLDSRASSITKSQSDAFDSWDTSALDPQIRDTIALAVPFRPGGTTLEPIPGSRPASPARALDGPFPAEPASGKTSPQERTERPRTAVSPVSRPATTYSHTSRRTANASPTGSRPGSSALPESHIHPLFRADSPVPPPAATPGTNITASPYSGHVIIAPSRKSSRSRLVSHPTSPVLGRESLDSVTPAATGTTITRSRSSSITQAQPPSRAMTPPIPEFILSASKERII